MKLKLLIVIPALGPIYGGPSKCVLDLAKTLGKLEINVDVVATNANGQTALDVTLQTWIEEPNYRLQYFPYWGQNDYKISFSFAQWLFKNVSQYDIIHANAIFSPSILPAYWAAQRAGVSYLATPHGMLEPWALSYKAGKKQLYYQFLEKPALNRASAIQMLSSAEAERIEPLKLKAPFIIVPNGLHKEDFTKLPSPDIFYEQFPHTKNKTLILFLGRIDPKKGLDLLASAFGQLHPKFQNAHLIIAGPDNIRFLPTTKDYFTQHQCLEAVTFTGMLTGEIKKSALSAASLYVAPSYSEGFSMSVLEGMASGLPCVITNGCNFPEAEEAKVAKVVDIDSEAIKQAMHWCLSYPQEAQAMGDRARQFILNHYTWDKIATQLIEIYTAICKQKPLK